MKKVLAGVLTAAAFLAGAGTATATVDWSGLPLLKSSGVRFDEGEYLFNPATRNHGAFEWKGKLKDAAPRDGHNVYVQVRIESHNWVRYNGEQGRTVPLHHSNWDGAQRYTEDAEIRACRDRGSLRPDNCSRTRTLSSDR